MTKVFKTLRVGLVAIAAGGLVSGAGLASSASADDGLVHVSGTVMQQLSDGTVVPAKDISVAAFGERRSLGGGETDGTGHYSFAAGQADEFQVHFTQSSTTHPASVDVWLGDTPFRSESDEVSIDHDEVLGVTTLPAGATISGTVVRAEGIADVNPMEATAFVRNPSTGLWQAGGRASLMSSGAYTISGLPKGEYVLRFGDLWQRLATDTVYWPDAETLSDSQVIHIDAGENASGYDATIGAGGAYVGRLAGADRYGTAAQISAFAFDAQVPVAYIADGLNYPDALSAGPAAAKLGGPVLLASPNSIPPDTRDELKRLQPGRIVVVGGTGAISDAVLAQLKDYSPKVDRVYGQNRYATSQAIVEDAFPDGTDTAFTATGRNFPDALAAGAAAGNDYGPVVLIDGAASTIDESTSTLIGGLGPRQLHVVGGTGVVTDAATDSLRDIDGVLRVDRYSGDDRYQTASAINEQSFAFADTAYLSTGANFPDALAGAAVAGRFGSPIFLVQPDCVPAQVLERLGALDVKYIVLLGGESVLSPGVASLTQCEGAAKLTEESRARSLSATRFASEPLTIPSEPGLPSARQRPATRR